MLTAKSRESSRCLSKLQKKGGHDDQESSASHYTHCILGWLRADTRTDCRADHCPQSHTSPADQHARADCCTDRCSHCYTRATHQHTGAAHQHASTADQHASAADQHASAIHRNTGAYRLT